MYTRKYYERQEDIRLELIVHIWGAGERLLDFPEFNQWNMLT